MTFDNLLVKLDDGAFMPVRAHVDDAGIDLLTPVDFSVPANGAITIDTGIHVEIPRGYYGKLESKSGLHIKHDIVCLGGVIDCGYTGSIAVKLHNFSRRHYRFKRGEKIVQLIIIPCETPIIVPVDSLGLSARGDNGFGSSGK